jgi:hypothetical protein
MGNVKKSGGFGLFALANLVLVAGCISDGEKGGPKEGGPLSWDDAAPARDCRFDNGEGQLLDQALSAMGYSRDDFGFHAEDLAHSGYQSMGVLDDPFRLSFFKDAREQAGRAGCLEGEIAHPLDHALKQAHPVATMIRHAAVFLDRAPDDALPFDPKDLPGDFDDALDALCALNQGQCTGGEGQLDPELKEALAPIFWALHESALAVQEMFTNPDIRPHTWWQENGGQFVLPQLGVAGIDPSNEATLELLLGREHLARVYRAASQLAFAVEHANLKSFRGKMNVAYEITTPVGRIRIADGEDHLHLDDGAPELFFMDLGGNDEYQGPVGATRNGRVNPVSLAIDLGGTDRYGYEETLPPPQEGLLPGDEDGRYRGDDNTGRVSLSNISRQGGARAGIAMLFDLGEEDDRYQSLRGSQGYAHLGVGVLMDAGGDDTYLSEAGSQGAAQFGIGIAMDRGQGQDNRHAFAYSQGFGFAGGAGLIVDEGGDDTYVCDHGAPDSGGVPIYYTAQMPGQGNTSFCQGAGFGRRGTNLSDHLSGGIGVLRDLTGDDVYEASVFGQGTGYWQGTGILSDGGGADEYDAYYYVQGAAAHYAIGILADGGTGDDVFNQKRAPRSVHLGAGHDFSLGVFINESGADRYALATLAAGASNCNGVGVFVDNGGDDHYQAASDYGSGMGNVSDECLNARPDAVSLGLMIDAGGTDTYAYPESPFPVPSEGGTWGHKRHGLDSEAGMGLDGEGFTDIHPGG